MNDGPLVVGDPLAEDVANGFPAGKVGGQIAPRTAAFDQIQDGVNDSAAILGRASAFGQFGQQRFEISPLGVGQVGVVFGDFHRLKSATAKDGPQKTQAKSRAFCGFYAKCLWPKPSSPFFRHALNKFWPAASWSYCGGRPRQASPVPLATRRCSKNFKPD